MLLRLLEKIQELENVLRTRLKQADTLLIEEILTIVRYLKTELEVLSEQKFPIIEPVESIIERIKTGYERLGFDIEHPVFQGIDRMPFFSPLKTMLALVVYCESITLNGQALTASTEAKDDCIYDMIDRLKLTQSDLTSLDYASVDLQVLLDFLQEMRDGLLDLIQPYLEKMHFDQLMPDDFKRFEQNIEKMIPLDELLKMDDRDIMMVYQRVINDGLITSEAVARYLYDVFFHHIDSPNVALAAQEFSDKAAHDFQAAIKSIQRKIDGEDSKSKSVFKREERLRERLASLEARYKSQLHKSHLPDDVQREINCTRGDMTGPEQN